MITAIMRQRDHDIPLLRWIVYRGYHLTAAMCSEAARAGNCNVASFEWLREHDAR
jgi:hypothetical protein